MPNGVSNSETGVEVLRGVSNWDSRRGSLCPQTRQVASTVRRWGWTGVERSVQQKLTTKGRNMQRIKWIFGFVFSHEGSLHCPLLITLDLRKKQRLYLLQACPVAEHGFGAEMVCYTWSQCGFLQPFIPEESGCHFPSFERKFSLICTSRLWGFNFWFTWITVFYFLSEEFWHIWGTSAPRHWDY